MTLAPVVVTSRVLDAGADVKLLQYDLDPVLLTPFNVVGGWGVFNAQPLYVNAGYFGSGKLIAPGIGDAIEFRFAMREGLYTCRHWFLPGPDCGRVTITLNDVALFTDLDLYDAAIQNASVSKLDQVDVADGLQSWKLVVTGKNALSADYFVRLNYFQFVPYLPGTV